MSLSDDTIVQHTEAWIRQVVVGCNFCPFAAKALLQKSVRYRVVRQPEAPGIMGLLAEELQYLDGQADTETTFIILPENFQDFEEYLDLTEAADELIVNEDYEGVYQVASFHPLYCFDGEPAGDPANYTNRSPYPMLHLLREASIEKALAHYKDPEGIPGRNIDFARKKGLAYMEALRAACLV